MARYKSNGVGALPACNHADGLQEDTLDAFVSQVYLPHVRVRKRSWRIDERIARKHLSPVFGDCPLSRIDRREVEDWLQGLLERGLAPASCNRFLAVLKTVCSLAEKRGLLPAGRSPCRGVSSFRVQTRRERYLSHNEARRLMLALEKSDCGEAQALRLLLLTGARKSEILKARWEDVNLELRLLTVPVSKSGKPRHIVLSDAAMAVIGKISRKDGVPWLFPGHAPGKPLSDLYLFWNSLRHELGLADVRIHDLRHTFASFLVNSGHSLYEVQKMLGHGDPRTTMRYAHLGQESLLAAAETVSGFFFGAGYRKKPLLAVRKQAFGRTGLHKRKSHCAAVKTMRRAGNVGRVPGGNGDPPSGPGQGFFGRDRTAHCQIH